MSFVICEYCGKLFCIDEAITHSCELPNFDYQNYEDVKKNIKCYTCGNKDIDNFTKSQIQKIGLARCKICTTNKIVDRKCMYPPDLKFNTFHKQGEELHNAVQNCDVVTVKQLLKNGADANYLGRKKVWIHNKWINSYTHDGEPEPCEEDDGILQPTRPLTLVAFRISDCLLNDSQLNSFNEIAKLLIDHGATRQPAIEMIEQRYGNVYNFDNPFTQVINTIKKYHNEQGLL